MEHVGPPRRVQVELGVAPHAGVVGQHKGHIARAHAARLRLGDKVGPRCRRRHCASLGARLSVMWARDEALRSGRLALVGSWLTSWFLSPTIQLSAHRSVDVLRRHIDAVGALPHDAALRHGWLEEQTTNTKSSRAVALF